MRVRLAQWLRRMAQQLNPRAEELHVHIDVETWIAAINKHQRRRGLPPIS